MGEVYFPLECRVNLVFQEKDPDPKKAEKGVHLGPFKEQHDCLRQKVTTIF